MALKNHAVSLFRDPIAAVKMELQYHRARARVRQANEARAPEPLHPADRHLLAVYGDDFADHLARERAGGSPSVSLDGYALYSRMAPFRFVVPTSG